MRNGILSSNSSEVGGEYVGDLVGGLGPGEGFELVIHELIQARIASGAVPRRYRLTSASRRPATSHRPVGLADACPGGEADVSCRGAERLALPYFAECPTPGPLGPSTLIVLMGECPTNGGTAASSDREMPSHLRRRKPSRAEKPEIGQSR